MGQGFLQPPLTRGLVAAALVLGAGCVHVHTDGDGKVKSVEVRLTDPAPAKATPPAAGPVQPAEARVPAGTDPAVKQAAAKVPAAALVLPKFPTLGAAPPQATELAVTWQNRIAFLPDPTKNGASGAGIVGQMFLFAAGPKMPFAPADGKLTVTMFDESPGRAAATPVQLGSWTFDKETLRRLITVDERFGKSYALFLPWPDYRPDTTRVKLTVRYDPDRGFPLYAEPSSLALDTSLPGGSAAAPPAAFPQPAVVTPLAAAAAPAAPIPLGGPPAAAGPLPPGLPPGLPPIVMTASPRR